MRPSCPPPKIPIVAPGRIGSRRLELTSASPSIRLRQHLVRPRRAPRHQRSRSSASVVASIATASSPAFAAPAAPIASVPTGTPFGICTIDSSESIPCSAVAGNRHAQHRNHRLRRDHARQMRRAARARDDHPQPPAHSRFGVLEQQIRRAMRRDHRTSCATPNSFSISTALRITA